MSWNWKFWKTVKPEPTTEDYIAEAADTMARIIAKKQAAWDSLPAHRKAARLEYRALQGLRYGRIEDWPPYVVRFYEKGVLMSECTIFPEQAQGS